MSNLSYCIGLDLGQAAEPTGLAVIEIPVYISPDVSLNLFSSVWSGWMSPGDLAPSQLHAARHGPPSPELPVLALRHLQRFPPGMSYPAIVKQAARLLTAPPLNRDTALIVDATVVGPPVVNLFVQAGLSPIVVTITGGVAVTSEGNNLTVPRRDLISAVAVLLQSERLTIAESLPDAPALISELLHFDARATRAQSDAVDVWRQGPQDDLVFSLALACWYHEWRNRESARGFCFQYTDLPGAPLPRGKSPHRA